MHRQNAEDNNENNEILTAEILIFSWNNLIYSL